MNIDLFQRILEEHAKITGWCPQQKALDLAAAVLTLRPNVVVELGVWGGKSLIPIAMACESINCGTVIAVDPWAASESVVGYDAVNAEWWGKQDHEAVYRSFLGHIERLGLGARIEVQRTTSALCTLPPVIDLCHLDSQHSEQAIRDVLRIAPLIRQGGIMAMDDLGWTIDGVPYVALAVKQLQSLGFSTLYTTNIPNVGHWGFFQKTHAPEHQRLSLPTSGTQSTATRPFLGRALAAPKRKAKK